MLGILKKYKKHNIEYFNIPISFDIETTSFYSKHLENKKAVTMYEWSFCINGFIIIGRTWNEFFEILEKISEYYSLSTEKRMIIYVHNLSYEFQFIRKMFEWERIFALEKRKIIQAVTDMGIEFRCSYLLSGYGLKKLGSQLQTYKVEKKAGDLDYKLLRNSKTKLTDTELIYCINDVLVVVAYIQELIEQYGSLTRLPLTKTGFVRQQCRQNCLPKNDNNTRTKYRQLMKSLILDKDTYEQLKRAFMGGFTHASAFYSGKVVENVSSDDFTSSYPAVMLYEKFPMSEPKVIESLTYEDFEKYLNLYCCLFDITFYNLESEIGYENYISKSHCSNIKNIIENNGRIVSADKITLTVTEQDFFIIKAMYSWDDAEISNFRIFQKGYLPTPLVKSILEFYNKKTTLKDVEGMEIEYLRSKENVNSTYGMCVTDIVRNEIVYQDNEWGEEEVDIEEKLNDYNKSVKRFLYYPWGVWVTAYARRNLFTGILELGEDYIYSDTDSVKYINRSKHLEYFKMFNNIVVEKLKKAMAHHKLDFELVKPKNIKGEEKLIGIWELEKGYDKFKSLGAKRYMFQQGDKFSLTVSGLNKNIAMPYILKNYDNPFDAFDDNLYIPKGFTGKQTHTYIDDEMEGTLTDYNGVTVHYHELSGVFLEDADYSLSLNQLYVNYLLQIKEYTK